jgi:hypothetical protein
MGVWPLVAWMFAATVQLQAAGGAPVSPDSVSAARDVRDPVFAYLVGLVDTDLYGTIDAHVLEEVVRRSRGKSRLPYRTLQSLTREPEPHRRVTVAFEERLRLPIPYEILTYNPGSLRASREVVLREYPLGDFVFDLEGREERVSDVHLFGVIEGAVLVDIDGWLDHLVGGKLDDTRVTGLALFRYNGERFGLAMGYNSEWKGRSGLLNLREDRIRFPSPPTMKTAAWKLRQFLERYEPSLRPDSLRAAGFWKG